MCRDKAGCRCEVAAAKDGSCGCDEVVLECSVKKQRLEDWAGSASQLYIAMDCEDPARFLVKDGRDGNRVAEGVGESGLFPGGIGCKRANSTQERSCCGA